jgi:hypothetical protein
VQIGKLEGLMVDQDKDRFFGGQKGAEAGFAHGVAPLLVERMWLGHSL